MHGGKSQPADRGSPEAGGAPVQTGLYSKYLRGEFADDYAAAEVGDLEHELRIARSYLAWAIRRHQKDQDGGAARIRLWADVVGEFINKVGRLEARRALLNRSGAASRGLPDLAGVDQEA